MPMLEKKLKTRKRTVQNAHCVKKMVVKDVLTVSPAGVKIIMPLCVDKTLTEAL